MRSLNCPSCNAHITINEDNRDFAFCEYCGTKIMFDDFRSTHRIVDEAKIKEAEAKENTRLKELELEAQEQKNKMILTIIKVIIGIAVLACAVVFFCSLEEYERTAMIMMIAMLAALVFMGKSKKD